MGRRAIRKEKQKHNTQTRTVWKSVERSVKRTELDTIASICGATRETIGCVISDATLTDAYNDGTAADERAATSESTTADSEPSTSTV